MSGVPRSKPQRGDMCIAPKIVQSLVFIVKPTINDTSIEGEVRNLASEGEVFCVFQSALLFFGFTIKFLKFGQFLLGA